MRRLLIISLVAILAGYAVWKVEATRSTTIRLESAGYDLTYSMVWGWRMEEQFSLKRVGTLLPGPSSGWAEIWQRPYNSGLALYRSVEGRTYYLRLANQLFTFEPMSGALKTFYCDTGLPRYTPLGLQLSMLKSQEEIEAADPGARYLFNYIEADQRGTRPQSTPDSRYYTSLKYLGKFGLVRSEGRGDQVGFVPADKAPEPRLSLNIDCP